jgi:hypothetical protein
VLIKIRSRYSWKSNVHFNWIMCSPIYFKIRLMMMSQIKVRLSLCFNWAPCQWGVLGKWRYSATHSLTSALDGGEWSASRPGSFTSREKAPDTHRIGGCVGPRAVLDAMLKRKIPSPCRESNPRTPIVLPVAQRYTDWAITNTKGKTGPVLNYG